MSKEQLEKLTADYQNIQEQLQSLALQKAQFTEQKEELKVAMGELDKAKGKVYSTIGGVMVETTKEEAVKNVKERQDSVEMRLSIIGKQYDDAARKEKGIRAEIESMVKAERGAK